MHHAKKMALTEALKRLKDGNPKVISKSDKINQRNVALEAGLSGSYIKSSNPQHASIIFEIKKLGKQDKDAIKALKDKIVLKDERIGTLTREVDELLGTQLMLIKEIEELKLKVNL
jgi:hypothetical protein